MFIVIKKSIESYNYHVKWTSNEEYDILVLLFNKQSHWCGLKWYILLDGADARLFLSLDWSGRRRASEKERYLVQMRRKANTERWVNAGLILGHRRRRWPKIRPALGQHTMDDCK